MQNLFDRTGSLQLAYAVPSRNDGLTPPPNVDVKYMVRLRATSEANLWSGLMDDAPAGVFVPTWRQHVLGSLVAIAVEIPGRSELIVLDTVVRWVRLGSDSSDCPPGVGLEFLSLSIQANRAVRRFAATRAPMLYDVE